MVLLVRILKGDWSKDDHGIWHFKKDIPEDLGTEILAKENESIEDFEHIVRGAFNICQTCPIMLTYQLPRWMLAPGGEDSPPQTLLSSGDVEVMMSIREWDGTQVIYVLFGAYRVAKYGFLHRSPFNIGNMTFLGYGITEEQHLALLKNMYHHDVFECCLRLFLELLTEEQMVKVHRLSLEIAKARNTIDLNDDPPYVGFADRTFSEEEMWLDADVGEDDNVASGGDTNEGLPPLPLSTYVANEAQYTAGNIQSPNGPLNPAAWEEDHGGSGYLEVICSQGCAFTNANFVTDTQENGVIDLECGNNSVESFGLQGSSTDSSAPPGFARNGNNFSLNNVTNFVGSGNTGDNPHFEKGESSKTMGIDNTETNDPMDSIGTCFSMQAPPPLNLCLTISENSEHQCNETPVDLEDSASDVGVDKGKSPHDPDVVYPGMIFKSREAFKQHMAFYAIRKKFRFRNSRSAPTGMVLRCFSGSCRWPVYAVLLKNTELYEVRRVELNHTCSVDDRSGYQTQATHTVIGELMKARFSGNGGGPRPNEIRQVMGGDHDVQISYWKAWRSREVALDYAKGTCGASYNLLPGYLDKLVTGNPGTISILHTALAEGIGQRFKYMFLAMGASIEGYKYMRKVIIVDGTHLRGKFAGCLLTASSQDGNYQVFPLAIAVVDGENDKSWEWFFKNLVKFVPNEEETVFISDRHPSIYYGLAKVYPDAKHCACILHLKRNIRSYFKDKHLGFLVGKAARAFRLSEFYTTFNEIKTINPSCADYLIGIGFEHWARAHCKGERYNVMTSNVAETWNAVLHKAREFPILPLVEYIRAKLMTWFSTRRELLNDGQTTLTPHAMEIVEGNFENSGVYGVHVISGMEYQVVDKQGIAYHVDLESKTCTCYEFQTLKIPCSHAISAATWKKISIESLVSDCYSLTTFKAAYAANINPVVESDDIDNLPSQMSGLNLEVPKKRNMCSRCKGYGHNKSTCKMAI